MSIVEQEVQRSIVVTSQSGINTRMELLGSNPDYRTFNAGVVAWQDHVVLIPRATRVASTGSNFRDLDGTILQSIILPYGDASNPRLIQPNIHFPQPEIVRDPDHNQGEIGIVQYEDVRMQAIDGEPSSRSDTLDRLGVIGGATAVIEGAVEVANWCASVIEGDISGEGFMPSRVRVFPYLPGKNLTPAGVSENGYRRFLFRNERKAQEPVVNTRDYHILDVLEDDGERLKISHELIIPKPEWARNQIGTQGPPRQLEDGRWLVPLHGFNKIPGNTPYGGIFDYKTGLSIVSEDFRTVEKVSNLPLFIRPDYDPLVGNQELNDFRKVVYCTGDTLLRSHKSPSKDVEISYVMNIGDIKSVIATVAFSDLMRLLEEPEIKRFRSPFERSYLRMAS